MRKNDRMSCCCPCARSSQDYCAEGTTEAVTRPRGTGTHHEEGVPDPEAPPGPWAWGHGLVLAVQRHRLSRGLAHGTAADVRADVLLRQRRHGQGRGAGQPVGPVVSPGVVAHLVDVAVGKGQCAKHREAGPRQTLGKRRDSLASEPPVLVCPATLLHVPCIDIYIDRVWAHGSPGQSVLLCWWKWVWAYPFLPPPWSRGPALIPVSQPRITPEPSTQPGAGGRATSTPLFSRLLAWPGLVGGWERTQAMKIPREQPYGWELGQELREG